MSASSPQTAGILASRKRRKEVEKRLVESQKDQERRIARERLAVRTKETKEDQEQASLFRHIILRVCNNGPELARQDLRFSGGGGGAVNLLPAYLEKRCETIAIQGESKKQRLKMELEQDMQRAFQNYEALVALSDSALLEDLSFSHQIVDHQEFSTCLARAASAKSRLQVWLNANLQVAHRNYHSQAARVDFVTQDETQREISFAKETT